MSGIALRFRDDPEDFRVDEVPLYTPCGTGEHLYLHVEKKGVSTPDLLRRLCSRFGLREVEVGIAGRKDARGVTSQWLSVPARKVEPEVSAIEALGPFRLLDVGRHGNKLRLGHLQGNRFTVRVVGDVAPLRLAERAAALMAEGCANYFGAQRFGPQSASLGEACVFFARGKPARSRKERFWISILQSAWFNQWLDQRVADGLFLQALAGDVLAKPTGASFICESPEIDTPRVLAQEVTPTGPMFGREMREASGAARAREDDVLRASGIAREELLGHPAFDSGTRRPARLVPIGVSVEPEAEGARLSFTLPKGGYATVLLQEWLGPDLKDAAFDDEA